MNIAVVAGQALEYNAMTMLVPDEMGVGHYESPLLPMIVIAITQSLHRLTICLCIIVGGDVHVDIRLRRRFRRRFRRRSAERRPAPLVQNSPLLSFRFLAHGAGPSDSLHDTRSSMHESPSRAV